MTTEAQTDPPLQWFIVNTFSGYENTVKKSLEDRIEANELEDCFDEILVPSEQVVETRGKRQVKQTRKFFPGYLFVHMELTKEAWHLVKNTPKVTGFLSSGKTPKPVSQSEMDRMLGRTEAKVEAEVVQPDVHYDVGQHVRVKQRRLRQLHGRGRRGQQREAQDQALGLDLRASDPSRGRLQRSRAGRRRLNHSW